MTIDLETLKNTDESAELQDNIDVITAGQILRDARIALGISVQQVSDNINLKLSVINNIEKSVLDKNISATFMRGYIRCYARYLKIDEDEVVRAYDCQNAACEGQAELQSFSRRTKLEAHDNRLMLVSYGIIGFMLIVFLIWGLKGDDVDVVVPEPEQIAVATSESIPTAAVEQSNVTKPAVVTPVVIADVVESEPVSAAPVVAEKPAKPAVVTPVVIADVVESEPVSAVPVVAEKPTKPAVVTQPLIVAFTGDCWVEIKDTNGKTLTTGVKKAGQTIQLQGLAPLSIKLGAPEQVTMSYAGEPVDLSTFKEGRLAKFKLPFKA